ncbi:MAG: hypothetical protein H0V17_32910 [Deltaproteobacteria bacterium]|nr:hypothetical protein [Deltaproteobacteria bacterium]
MKPFKAISLEDLSRVSGGFLPLLGLIGAGASLAGQVTGAIGQSKAKKAEAIMAEAQAGAARGGGAPAAASAGPAPASPTGSVSADGLTKITTNVSIS